MNIATWLQRRAHQTPNSDALFIGTDCVATYQNFDQKARALGRWVTNLGLKSGDRIAMFMENTPDFLYVLYGVWYAGGVVVPINAKLHAQETAWIINDANATLTFASASKAAA